MIKIRKATASDLPQLVNLYLEYQKEEKKLTNVDRSRWMITKTGILQDLRDYVLEQNKLLRVLVDKDKITGFILGSFKRSKKYAIKNYGTIDEIYIIPKMRGRGLSSRLKDEFIKWFKERKIGKGVIALFVMPQNKVAQEAYKKWGFTISDLKLVKEFK